MKTLLHFLHSFFTSPAAIAANDAATDDIFAINEAAYAVNEDGVMVVPFSEVPVMVSINGRSVRGLQRIDAQAANDLAADMADPLQSPDTKTGVIARLGAWVVSKMGRPIFWGHPDHPLESMAAKYPDKRGRGFVKSILVANEEQALKLVPTYNRLGGDEVKDQQVFGHSPLWRMRPVIAANGQQEIKDGMPVFRPYSLQSVGLTNSPNIPGAVLSANEEMKPAVMDVSKILAALTEAGITKADDDELTVLSGIQRIKEEIQWARERKESDARRLQMLRQMLPSAANEATEEELLESLLKQSEATAANEVELSGKLATLTADITAANERFTAARAAHVNTALAPLIAANKIPGSQIETLRTELIAAANETDIDSRIQELSRTKPRLGTTGGVTDALKENASKLVMAANEASARSKQRNEAVSDCLAEITAGRKAKPGDQEAAWNLARSRNPELFAR